MQRRSEIGVTSTGYRTGPGYGRPGKNWQTIEVITAIKSGNFACETEESN